MLTPNRSIQAGVLNVALHEAGPVAGPPVFLMHGFPYDIQAYAEVVPRLVAQGCRVYVPFLRGFGPTQFLRSDSMRTGEQAALGADLLALMDALQVPQAVLAGYDWGGRAACVVAALWPERCTGLVSYNHYNIFNIARAMEPDSPANERSLWYQYYFHSERGRAGLAAHRFDLCKLLWQLWSPTWAFDDATYARSATAFENPDFVEVVIHSYRHRFGLVAGDPAYAAIEAKLALQPRIEVPCITFDGEADGVRPPTPAVRNAHLFGADRQHRIVPKLGHNMPQEMPQLFADAVLELVRA